VTPQQREVRDRVAAAAERLAAAARAADPEPPAPGEWPPTDVVRHLIAVEEEVWHPRLRQLAAEDEPVWAWVEPDRWHGSPVATLDELLAVHRALRTMTTAMLDDLGEAGWAKTGVHATFGRLDAAGLMARALDHDDEHIASFAR
jgi:DinB superfamily